MRPEREGERLCHRLLLRHAIAKWIPALSARTTLICVLAIAAVIRVALLLTQTYVVFIDETFQYFEQGHRLAFGSGVVPWEFFDGLRSWLLPGLITLLMRVTALLDDDPVWYLRLTRLACIALSLSVVAVGFSLALRRDGRWAALLTGGICAVWFDLIWFAPAVMTEVVATHLVLVAIWLGDERARAFSP